MRLFEISRQKPNSHEGNELELMLQGLKPAGIVNGKANGEIDDKFAPYVNNGTFVHYPYKAESGVFKGWIYHFIALPSEKWRLQELVNQFKNKETINHRYVGELLGYSTQEIDNFLGMEI